MYINKIMTILSLWHKSRPGGNGSVRVETELVQWPHSRYLTAILAMNFFLELSSIHLELFMIMTFLFGITFLWKLLFQSNLCHVSDFWSWLYFSLLVQFFRISHIIYKDRDNIRRKLFFIFIDKLLEY